MIPSGFFIFLPIKWALALVIVGAGASAALLRGRIVSMKAWVALLLVIGAATLTSVSWPTSVIGSGGRNLGLIAWIGFAGSFYLGAVIGRDVKQILIVAAAASIPVSLYALLQSAGLDFFEWYEELDLSRSRSTFGSATFLGGYLTLILPISIRLFFDGNRALFGVAATLAAAALITTQTRGAWIGAAAAIMVLAVMERSRIRANLRPFAVAGGLFTAILLILVIFTPVGARASIADIGAGTARGRLVQWELTLDMIADRPLLGWGPDTYILAFPRYISAEFERVAGRIAIPDRAHNSLLDLTSTIGLLGLAAYIWVLFTVFRTRKRDPVTVAITAALAGYLTQMLFAFPVADIDFIFWLFAGMAAATAVRERPISKSWGYTIAALTLVLGIWAARDVVADVKLRSALEYEAAGRFAEANREFNAAAATAPERIQYLQASARFKMRAQLFEQALEEIERAEVYSHNDIELWTDRADIYLSWGEVAGNQELIGRAEREYRRVLEVDPNSSRVLLKLGVTLANLGRLNEAEETWLEAESLAPRSVGPALNLATLYEQSGRVDAALRYYERVLTIEPDNQAAREGIERLRS